MVNNQKGNAAPEVIGFLIYLVVIVIGIWGWVWNIIKIIDHTGEWGGEMVLRVIGIFMAPLGSVMGFL